MMLHIDFGKEMLCRGSVVTLPYRTEEGKVMTLRMDISFTKREDDQVLPVVESQVPDFIKRLEKAGSGKIKKWLVEDGRIVIHAEEKVCMKVFELITKEYEKQ